MKMNLQRLSLLIFTGIVVLSGTSACAGNAALATAPADADSAAQPAITVVEPALPLTSTMTVLPSPSPEETDISQVRTAVSFDAERAYQDVEYQLSLGPRTPGSPAHDQIIEWMQAELSANGWEVEVQETTYKNQPVRNVIAKRGEGNSPWVIFGAHFDSRMKADQDQQSPDTPVPGANDGASGVAVLMEIARVLPEDLDQQVWLAFFDSEDQGRLPGWDWIYGSRAFAESLTTNPDAVIIVDMIGDADLNIYQERNSDVELTQQVWAAADELGYEQFIPEPKHSMLDDHTPFLERGIRAIDIIDFDYPYWHTMQDTADKVSPDSLKAVGDTLLHWVQQDWSSRLP